MFVKIIKVTLTNFYTVLFTGDVTCPDFLIRFDYLVFQKGVWPGPSGAYSEKSRFEKQKINRMRKSNQVASPLNKTVVGDQDVNAGFPLTALTFSLLANFTKLYQKR